MIITSIYSTEAILVIQLQYKIGYLV